MNDRVATLDDLEAATRTIASAFDGDPLWRWAFPPVVGSEGYRAWWRMYLRGGIPHGTVRVTDGCEATALWLPSEADELLPEDEERLESLVRRLVGDARAPAVMELLARFDAAHPREEPHRYLSLLGTHADHRGRGIGMDLLRSNLARLDAEGTPAYLESTNPSNLDRYRSVGFRVVGRFEAPDGGPLVTTMWRDPR